MVKSIQIKEYAYFVERLRKTRKETIIPTPAKKEA